MTKCNICDGRKTIRLPVYKESSIQSDNISYKEYPCPECSQLYIKDIKILRSKHTYDHNFLENSNVDNKDFRDYITKNIAHDMANKILEDGLIVFKSKKSNIENYLEIEGSLGVVSANDITNFENEVEKRIEQIFEELKREVENFKLSTPVWPGPVHRFYF